MPSGVYKRTTNGRANMSKAAKGKPSWRKGLTKETDASIMKQSISKTGYTFSKESKLKMSKSHKGKKLSKETIKKKLKMVLGLFVIYMQRLGSFLVEKIVKIVI